MVTCVITLDMLGKPSGVAWEEMAARHFVATVRHESFTTDDDRELASAKIDGLEMYHVSSPNVAAVPKDAEVMGPDERDVPVLFDLMLYDSGGIKRFFQLT